jgi:ATP-dependent protease ClpP protease subunit
MMGASTPRDRASSFVVLMLAAAFPFALSAGELSISGFAPPTNPMLKHLLGSSWTIYLEGEIDANAGKRLRAFVEANSVPRNSHVVLNSPGGSLPGGLELGRAIRRNDFTTTVGVKKIDASGTRGADPGICFSACAVAFLGGRFRFLMEGSRYGVHRFYFSTAGRSDADLAQMMSAVVVNYLTEMEIDTGLFALTTVAGRDQVLEPSRAKLEELRVINNGFTSPRWTVESNQGLIYLKGERETVFGVNKFILFCERGKGVSLYVVFDPQGREDEVMTLGAHSLVINGKDAPITAAQKSIKNGWFNVAYSLSSMQVRQIRQASTVGLIVRPTYQAAIFLGFDKMQFKEGASKLEGLLNSCEYQD